MYSLPEHIRLLATLALMLASTLLLSTTAGAQQIIRYPAPESSADQRASYPVALLHLCARQSKNAFAVKPAEFHSQQARSIRQLARGEGIDVLWAVTNSERENTLLPIRIPIDRGLIGWRLMLIRSADSAQFQRIASVAQLAPLRAGQGHDWPDVAVLNANRLSVATSTTYESLFKMLATGHIDYFPRAVSEIWPELAAHPSLGLEVDDSLVLHYPEALYFFVNRNNSTLAAQLTTCLNRTTQDGSLRTLFYEHYRDDIQRANFQKRTVIELSNPLLPTETPLKKSMYWFSPGEHQ